MGLHETSVIFVVLRIVVTIEIHEQVAGVPQETLSNRNSPADDGAVHRHFTT